MKKRAGVTMIELLIYMAIFATLLIVLTELFVSILNVKQEAESVSAAEQDGINFLYKYNYDLHIADSVTTPANPGDTSSTLEIVIGGSTYTYALDNNRMQLTGPSGSSYITSQSTSISGLQFEKVGPAGAEAIKVNFAIDSTNANDALNESITYQTVIALRE